MSGNKGNQLNFEYVLTIDMVLLNIVSSISVIIK